MKINGRLFWLPEGAVENSPGWSAAEPWESMPMIAGVPEGRSIFDLAPQALRSRATSWNCRLRKWNFYSAGGAAFVSPAPRRWGAGG